MIYIKYICIYIKRICIYLKHIKTLLKRIKICLRRIAIYLKRIMTTDSPVRTIEKCLLTYICHHQVVHLQNKCELSRSHWGLHQHCSGKNLLKPKIFYQ